MIDKKIHKTWAKRLSWVVFMCQVGCSIYM